jgi:hypothetical protein
LGDVLTATEVANVLTFVAPGFFSLTAYRYEFPRSARERFGALTVCVAISVPLVASAELIRGWIGVERDPLGPAYVTLLLIVSSLAGYGVARLRGWRRARRLLGRLGLRQEPEDSPFLRVVRSLSDPEAQMTVTFKDGSVLAGTPSFWTSDPDAAREVFLTHTRWFDKEAQAWGVQRNMGGVLVRLDEVWAIELDRDPG